MKRKLRPWEEEACNLTPKVGDIVTRPISFTEHFAEAIEGPYITSSPFRAVTGWAKFEAVPFGHFGLVCFCPVPIPEDWIFFEITEVAKSGRSVTVHPVRPESAEAMKRWLGSYERAYEFVGWPDVHKYRWVVRSLR